MERQQLESPDSRSFVKSPGYHLATEGLGDAEPPSQSLLGLAEGLAAQGIVDPETMNPDRLRRTLEITIDGLASLPGKPMPRPG